MPCKKKKQPLPKPKCTLSSRRLLETVPIQDLRQSVVVCVPSSKQVNEPSPSGCGSCGCDDDGSATGTCCALDPQCEESDRSRSETELKIEPCVPNCQPTEVEAMIDEIRNCREIIRTLALEAMDILHPEGSQQYKQNFQAQQGPIANGKVSCYEHYDDPEANPIEPASQPKPIDLRQQIDCSKNKCEISEPSKYSGLEGQSTTRSLAIPSSLLKSPAPSRKSSGPIAQTACQIKDRRLVQKVVRKKPSNCSCDGEKKQNIDCSCDETMIKKTLGLKFSECSCDGEKKKKADCRCVEKPESKRDCKTFIISTFGKKPSECSCDGEIKQKKDCKCVERMKKQNKENEKRENKTDSKSFLQKTFGWINSDTAPAIADDCVYDDEEMEKQNKANSLKEKRRAASVAAACAMPKCAANTCTCHFPPAYSQYFDCTGHVSGNCRCDKNA